MMHTRLSKNLFFVIIAITLSMTFYYFQYSHIKHKISGDEDGMEEDLSARIKWLNKTLSNPLTGEIPANIRHHELAFAATLPKEQTSNKFATWVQQGPWNVGGRTRALGIDLDNENVLVAGAATGGIWRSTDAGNSWRKSTIINAPTANITCMVQDRRANKHQIWYAGTGELYGGSLPGAFYSGSGVYKSTDGGVTWQATTNFNVSPGGISNSWSVIHDIEVNHTIDSIDVVFVANFDGIFRSINGGTSWTKIRGTGIGSGYSYFTDIAISPAGVLYATLSAGGTQSGIWRSTDNGKTWANITPAFFTTTTNRIAIAISPSDEKQIYFTANTPGTGMQSFNFEGSPEWNSLWKYTYISGDGTGSGGQWQDRSANIPKFGGDFGDFISQGSYCLEVDVKPDDPNTVFLGGTNLYRSTDGFSTKNNIQWIGGYGVNTKRPDFKTYTNHHPDQHGVYFYPNTAKMISVHDGGISRTSDCMASGVQWSSLNNGYLTTQFYTVAIDPTGNGNTILGGLQDNGSYITTSSNTQSAWTMPLTYDGAWCYKRPGQNEIYVSKQQGGVHRIMTDANGIPTQFTRVDPQGIDKNKYQFINPFAIDPNNWYKMYIPAGDVLWRNDDISAIPLKNQLDSTPTLLNWTKLNNTKLSDSLDEITAIITSRIESDVVYYGTQKGKFYKLSQASSNTSIPMNLSGGNFPSAYINCITQHPKDSNTLYAVFTNYGVLSIFETKNGGANWSPVSGNLEQNTNGTGNGPSCRWLTIASVGDTLIYYVGTSTGLYATKYINGMQTQWLQQSSDLIGNNVVMMMDFRKSDGKMAVATYGAGIFTANVLSVNPHTAAANFDVLDKLEVYPNPSNEKIWLDIENRQQYECNIYSYNGQLVTHCNQTPETINTSTLPNGIYFLELRNSKNVITKKLLINH